MGISAFAATSSNHHLVTHPGIQRLSEQVAISCNTGIGNFSGPDHAIRKSPPKPKLDPRASLHLDPISWWEFWDQQALLATRNHEMGGREKVNCCFVCREQTIAPSVSILRTVLIVLKNVPTAFRGPTASFSNTPMSTVNVTLVTRTVPKGKHASLSNKSRLPKACLA